MPSTNYRRGMTFVELLVAMTLSMILIYGMAAAFGRVGQAASDGRAAIEMANQTRNVMNRLRMDLEGVTVPMRQWSSTGGAHGYFEAVEGPRKEHTDIANPISAIRLFGDLDDVLMFTTRSQTESFRGRFVAGGVVRMIESSLAEVIYAATPIDAPLTVDSVPRNFYLHRRAMLIRPDLNGAVGHLLQRIEPVGNIASLEQAYLQFINANDISVRASLTPTSSGDLRLRVIANSLEDLAVRENRFAHRPLRTTAGPLLDNNVVANFPHTIFQVLASGALSYNAVFRSMFTQPDTTLMSHAIAFDVKLYDPMAPNYLSTDLTTVVQPSDPGFYVMPSQSATPVVDPNTPASLRGRGGFVDLGYARAAVHDGLMDHTERLLVRSSFSDWPENGGGIDKSQLQQFAIAGRNTFHYDTWSDFYERNGFNEDGDTVNVGGAPAPLIDEGTDGVDNNGGAGIDEFAEQETAPPYATQLRGVQVTVRLYETDTRQVRQMSVVNDFIPE